MKILITGAAGFIGSALCTRLAERGDEVIGLDNINAYYDTRLKMGRLSECGIMFSDGDCLWNRFIQSHKFPNYKFIRLDLGDKERLNQLFSQEKFDKVVNLAAQAGVRYSITNPDTYIESNLIGFFHLLECCRNHQIKHLVFASSSSVYGMNAKVPFSEDDKTDTPVSLYAASKKSNELMAHAYSKLYGIQTTGLRYFTVYGPWGRPDMAPMIFAKSIFADETINVFNHGQLSRDFTYIDDIVAGTIRVIDRMPISDKCTDSIPFKIYNIGCSNPVRLTDFITELETSIGKPARKNYLPMQPGDVFHTYADTSKLEHELGYKPQVNLHEGIARFVDWYKSDKNPLR